MLGEVLLAGALATGRLTFLLLAALGALGLAFAFTFPMTVAVGTLVLGASVFHGQWFEYSFGPLSANGAEVLLAALFVVALTRPRSRTWGGVAGTGLGVFLLLLGVATAVAVADGTVELLSSFAWGRVFLLFTYFYCVVRLFDDRESIARLLGWAAGIAAATGLVALYVSVASGPTSALQDPAEQFIREEEGLGIIQRVRLPGLSLAYALFWYAIVRAIRTHGSRRLLWTAATGGMFVNIAVSFNRNMWVGLTVGLVLMLLLAGPQVRRRLVGGLAAAAVLFLLILPSQLGSEEKLTPLVKRGTSLTNPESLRAEASLQSRENETEVAWDVALDNPLIGIGPGVDFGVSFIEATGGGGWVRVPQLFLHNQYLYLMLIAGIPALAAFLAYLLASLRLAWAWRLRTPESAAWGVGLASIMLSAFVAIYFSAADMVFAISLLTGAIFVTRSDREEAGEGA